MKYEILFVWITIYYELSIYITCMASILNFRRLCLCSPKCGGRFDRNIASESRVMRNVSVKIAVVFFLNTVSSHPVALLEAPILSTVHTSYVIGIYHIQIPLFLKNSSFFSF